MPDINSSFVAFLIFSAGSGLSVLVAVALAAVLPPEDYAIYSGLLNLIVFLVGIASLANGSVFVKFLNERGQEPDDPQARQQFYHWARRRSLILVSYLAIAFCLFCLIYFYLVGYAHNSLLIIGATLLLLVLTGCGVVSAVLRANGLIFLSLFPRQIVRYLLLLLPLFVLSLLGIDVAIEIVFLLELLSLVFVLLVLWIGKDRRLPELSVTQSADQDQIARWKTTTFQLNMATVSQQLVSSFDVLIVGYLFGLTEGAVYALASRVSKLMVLGNKAANEVAARQIAQFYANDERDQLKRVVVNTCRWACGLATIISFGLLIVWILLPKSYYADYPDLGVVFLILILGQVVNSATGPVGILMNLTDHQMLHLKINLVQAFVLFLGLFVLSVLDSSIISVAVFLSIGLVCVNLVKSVYVFKRLRLVVLPIYIK